jgi:DNA-binding transcriptional LysR family regulator
VKKKISIGASSYAGDYLLPRMLPDWSQADADSELKVEIADSENIFQQVLNGDLEVGLIGVCFEHDDVDTKEFITNDELVLIAPSNHPLAQKDEISVNDLRGQNFLIREPGSATRMWCRESLAKEGLSLDELNIVAELDTHMAIITGVGAGSGIALVPKMAAKEAIELGRIKELWIKELSPIKGSICTIYNKDYLSEDGRKVLSFLDMEKPKIEQMIAA